MYDLLLSFTYRRQFFRGNFWGFFKGTIREARRCRFKLSQIIKIEFLHQTKLVWLQRFWIVCL
jgi:hypothetical protein